ncbi:MAG: hypothetical protein ABIP89_13425, partial [Polyangiaceae bacterium]
STSLLACNNNGSSGGSVQTTSPASASAVASAAIPAAPSTSVTPRGSGKGPGHGGVDAILFTEARALPSLTDAQKATIDGLEGQLHDRDTAPRDAMKAFSTDLAAQVRAGKIDLAKLKPDQLANEAAMKGMVDKQAKALGGLHDALDAAQRKAVVDAARAKSAAHEAKLGERDSGTADFTARKLERMTTELGLDAAQQKVIGALIAKQANGSGVDAMRDDMKKQMDATLTAFQADSFDAQKTFAQTMSMAKTGLDKQVVFVSQLLPILRPDQREKLAASTEKPAMGRERYDAH